MNDPRRDMITTLEARGPHPSIGDQAQTFDRFVGTWDCDYASFKEDGTTEHAKGEVIFGWVLDGRAVQDIWTWIDKHTSGERKLGTTVRFFDPKIGKWRIVWIDPVSYAIKILSGGAIGARIVLEGTADEGVRMRWSFNDIRRDSFIWRGEKSRDDGRTWRLTDEYHLERRSAASADNLKKRGWSLGWVLAVDRRRANDLDRLAPAGPPRDACAYPETKPDVPCEGSNSVR